MDIWEMSWRNQRPAADGKHMSGAEMSGRGVHRFAPALQRLAAMILEAFIRAGQVWQKTVDSGPIQRPHHLDCEVAQLVALIEQCADDQDAARPLLVKTDGIFAGTGRGGP